MAIEDAVPLYLTLLMVVLAVIAFIGGSRMDKESGDTEKKD